MEQFVYLIRLREFIRLNESTYKIGKTTQTPKSRLSGYPKGTEVIVFLSVKDCSITENMIMKSFCDKFIQKIEYGTEYFFGDPTQMLTEMVTIIKSCPHGNPNLKFFCDPNVAPNVYIPIDIAFQTINICDPLQKSLERICYQQGGNIGGTKSNHINDYVNRDDYASSDDDSVDDFTKLFSLYCEQKAALLDNDNNNFEKYGDCEVCYNTGEKYWTEGFYQDCDDCGRTNSNNKFGIFDKD